MYISNEDFVRVEEKKEGNCFQFLEEIYNKHCKDIRRVDISLEYYENFEKKYLSCRIYKDGNLSEIAKDFKNINGNFEYKVVEVFWEDNDGDDESGRPIIRTGYDTHIYIESIVSDKEMIEIKEHKIKKLEKYAQDFNSIIYLRSKGNSYTIKGNTVEIANSKFELSSEFIRSLEHIQSFTKYVYIIKKYSLKFDVKPVLDFINYIFDEDDENKFEPIDYDNFVDSLDLDDEEYDLDSMYDLYVKYLKELKEKGCITLDVSDFKKANETALSEKDFSLQYYYGNQLENDKKENIVACAKKNVEGEYNFNKLFLSLDCIKFSSINVCVTDIENWI